MLHIHFYTPDQKSIWCDVWTPGEPSRCVAIEVPFLIPGHALLVIAISMTVFLNTIYRGLKR